VTVDNTTQAINDGPQTIDMDFSFTADTTGQSGAAFGDIVDVKVNYGTIEDLIPGENTVDEGNKDDGESVATLISETLTGPLFQRGSNLLGTVELTDLEAGEQVVVRIDVKLFCDPGSNPTGNLQADLQDSRLTFINGTTQESGAISGGQQTIPLKQIGDLLTPELDIQKTVNTTDGTCPGLETLTITAGDMVKYCYVVSNSGDAPLYNVNVIDDAGTPSNTADDFTVILSSGLTDVDGDGNADDLAAGATATGTALVALSTVGTIINNATAVGDDSILEPTKLIDYDIATVIVEGTPSYTIDKKVVGVDEIGDGIINNAGEVIEYQIIVNNTGNIDLTNVTVTDPLLGTLNGPTGDNAPVNILNIGESWIFTGNYTVKQSDINNNGIDANGSSDGDGDIDNTATVDCDQLDQKQDSEAVPITRSAAYTIEKIVTDVDGEGAQSSVDEAGDVISYQINVTNTGNVDLTNVTVTDPLLGTLNGPTGDNTPVNILNIGESWIFTGTYTVKQADINNNGIDANGSFDGDGDIDNTATVDCDQLDPKDDTAEVPIEQDAAYTIDKKVTDVDGEGAQASVDEAGDVISYQINVTNTGNIDLTNVTVMDSLIESLNGPVESLNTDGILEVGESWTYTGTYTAALEDISTNGGGDGFIENMATVDCDQLDPISDSASVPIKVPVCENPAYKIEKCITDVDCRGPTASVKEAGDVITYRITVTNTGDVDLTNVVVTDSLIALAGPTESKNKDSVLEVGETWTYTGKYTVTQNDIDTDGGCDGYIDNVATVDCDQLDPISDSARAPIEATETCPAYKIEKCVTDVDCRGPNSNVTGAGDVITYRITVTNTGDVDLTNVVVTDPLIETLKGPVESKNANRVLNVGETWTYTGCYVVTQADMDNNGKCAVSVNNVAMVNCDEDTVSECEGYIDNIATVDCDQLGPKSDSVRVLIEKESTDDDVTDDNSTDVKQDYCIYKSIIGVDEAGDCIINEAGDIIEYQIIVKNEGNGNLTGVSVNDPMIALTGPTGDENDPGVLNPGETWKFFGNYTVTQEDISSNGGGDGFIENNATVSCNELPDESSSVKQQIVLSSNDEDNGSDGDDGTDGNDESGGSDGDTESDGDTGSAHIIHKSSTNDQAGKGVKETGTGVELEPEIKSFEEVTENIGGDAERVPEQEESTGMPGYLIYGIIGLLAIILLALMSRKKNE
jgi:uncharacterized repeat protein (TIGR01451 family)